MDFIGTPCRDDQCPHAYCDALRWRAEGLYVVAIPGRDQDGDRVVYTRALRFRRRARRTAAAHPRMFAIGATVDSREYALKTGAIVTERT